MEKLEFFFNKEETTLAVVRFKSRRTALVAVDPSAVYLLQLSPTREEADRAGALLQSGGLSVWSSHGIFPLTRVECMEYTVIGN